MTAVIYPTYLFAADAAMLSVSQQSGPPLLFCEE
jgi:hypothetical protein